MAAKERRKTPDRKATTKAGNVVCKHLWARRVNVNDEQDRLRATIAAEGSQAFVALFDENGLERVSIRVEGKEDAVIGIMGKKGILVGMRVGANGRRVLQVNDDEGHCVFEAGVDTDEMPFIQLVNPDGSIVWKMKRQQ